MGEQSSPVVLRARNLAFKDLGFSLQEIRGLLAETVPFGQIREILRLKRAELERDVYLVQAVRSVRANYTNSRLPPRCQQRPIVLPVLRWHDWQSATGTSHWRGSSGNARWEILARGTKLTSSWRSTMECRPVRQR